MAALTQTTMQGSGQRTVTGNTLTAADTLTYLPNTGQLLVVKNPTGGSITVNIKGSSASNLQLPGVGVIATLNSGYDLVVAAGSYEIVNLDESRLQMVSTTNTVNLTGGTNLIAWLFGF